MKRVGDILILDELLAQYAGEPAWEGVAWANADEHEAEKAAQAQAHRSRRLSAFLESLPPRYRRFTLDALRLNPGNRAAFDAAQALQPDQNLFLHGPPGTGKTHLAVATGRRFAAAGLTVRSFGVVELVHQTRQSFNGSAPAPDLLSPAVLILDDLGKLKATEWAFELLYAAVEHRWSHELCTIVTANHKPREAATSASVESANATALLSRLASGVTALVTGDDQRIGEVAK